MRRSQNRSSWLTPILLSFVFCTCPQLLADDPAGQADLDAATSLKLSASSMADLERVIELTESALEKGLDEQNETLAKSLLTATLFQHGSRFAQALLDPRQRAERPEMLKQFALKDLYKILEYDESLPRVYMMIARLEGVNVNRQNRAAVQQAQKKGIEAADKAIELLEDDKPMQSKALLLRAGYTAADSEQRIEILNRALEADPANTDALRMRGKSRLLKGEMLAAVGKQDEAQDVRAQAVEDFMKLLEANPDDADALQSGAELLGRLGNYEKAMEFADKVIEQNPSVFTVYLLRARLNHKQGNFEQAIQDLNRAVDIRPDNFLAYLDRAEVYADHGDVKAAAKDYGKARDLQGQLPGIVIRRMLLRSQNDVAKGIEEIKKFLELDEANAETAGRDPDPEYRLQLSATYNDQSMPVELIDVLTPLIELRRDRTYSEESRDLAALLLALRTRANTYLSIGRHAEAIDDYKKWDSLKPNDSHILNNLAWVLATSPHDELRNPQEAIEIATKACEVTEYKQAHILSTLAAAYADSGDFESAKQYSKQAVELAEAADANQQDEEILNQLRQELESYEKEEPWRELQNVLEEKKTSDDAVEQDTESKSEDDQERPGEESSGEESSGEESSGEEPAAVE